MSTAQEQRATLKRIHALQQAFERTYRTDAAKALLQPRWREENSKEGAPPSTGFCYIAAEAAFHLLSDLNPKPFCASYVEDDGQSATHWWIVAGSFIVDPTHTQYTDIGFNPPHHLGQAKGFLTKTPSQRAATLMQLVREEMGTE